MKKLITAALLSTSLFTNLALGQDAVGGGNDNTEEIALLALLGLEGVDGTTTLGAGAGTAEVAILTSILTRLAGQKIRRDIMTQFNAYATTPIIVLPTNSDLNLTDFGIINAFIKNSNDIIHINFNPLPKGQCENMEDVNNLSGISIDENTIPADILSTISTDQTINRVTVNLNDQTLINAIISTDKSIMGQQLNTIIPSEIIVFDPDSELIRDINNINMKVSPYQDGKCREIGDTIPKNTITGLKERADNIIQNLNRLTANGTNGQPSVLSRAVLQGSAINDAGEDLRVLRVHTDAVEGTVISKSNIFTMTGLNRIFGPKSLTANGALIVSYRLSNPFTGEIITEDQLICGTRGVSLKKNSPIKKITKFN